MVKSDGVVRVVFATTALGMGVDFARLHTVIHYGAPRCIDNYFQESGRAGRDRGQSTSTIYWLPLDAPLKDPTIPRNAEVAQVRRYLENSKDCRRCQVLQYFDEGLVKSLGRRDQSTCCDVCKVGLC